MILKTFFLVFYAWFLLSLWQLVASPFLIVVFQKKFKDAAWGFGRVAIWLFLGLTIWLLAHLGLPVNTKIFLWLLFLGTSYLSYNFFENHRRQIINFFKKNGKIILIEEALFLFGFCFLSIIRNFKPDILDLEKFMDFGFMTSYLRSSTLPAVDMWFAGEKINYYTFGHFLGSVVTNFWGIRPAIAYNLCLALIMGLLMIEVFSIVLNLAAPILNFKKQLKLLIIPGLIAVYLVSFGGNTQTIWYRWTNGSFESYWYPDATRFIERTIHEFPTYSFIVSDLHAHVWSLPVVFLLLISIYNWLQDLLKDYKEKLKPGLSYLYSALLVGTILGAIVGTNAWDAAIYSLLLVILGVVLLIFNLNYFLALFLSALTMVFAMTVISSPWWLNFEPISEGIKAAYEHSALWQFLVLWTGHITVSAIALALVLKKLLQKGKLKKQANLLLIMAMVLTAWILLFLPEIVFVKDIYPNHPRANTMFKLTFQAFSMMNITAVMIPVLVARSSSAKVSLTSIKKIANIKKLWRKLLNSNNEDKSGFIVGFLLKLILVIYIMVVGIYPFFGYRDYYNLRFKTDKNLTGWERWQSLEFTGKFQGLDGIVWLEKQHPSDYQAILWLQEHVYGRPVVVEAVGESYTTFARVSAYTGLPTIVGWRVHEWLWRGGLDIPAQRTEEVKIIYEKPLTRNSRLLLDKYQVEYIFVGDKEREAYKKIDLVGIQKLGKLVFSEDSTFIVRLPAK